MTAFRDGINADVNGKDFSRTVEEVDSSRQIPVQLAPGGGFSAVITPKQTSHPKN